MIFTILFFSITLITNAKVFITDSKRPFKEELIRRIDCWLWPVDSCPQDGGWSEWGDWGECRGECGQVGLRERVRQCNSPPPSNGGLPCPGQYHQEVECKIPGCSEADYEEILMGDDMRMKQLRLIKKAHSQYPSLIDRCLEAECHFNSVESILKEYSDRYWNALHCVKYNIGCPVVGGWSGWGRWSECSALCGHGVQIRCRSCDNPVPTFTQFDCKGENCTLKPCLGTLCGPNLNGAVWTDWTTWSPCSASCGPGLSKRTRTCSIGEESTYLNLEGSQDLAPQNSTDASTSVPHFPPCLYYPIRMLPHNRSRQTYIMTSDISCEGPHVELKSCHIKPCPVDGVWSEWKPWSQCSLACGIGVQSSSRACSSPPPRNGGLRCKGPVTHYKHCFLEPCSVINHEVVSFFGDGLLKYSDMGRNRRLLHIFVRFRPLGLNGCILLRIPHEAYSDYVSLSLAGGYIVFAASIERCQILLINFERVVLGKWIKVLLKVTPRGASMRIDDNKTSLKSNFSCQPKLPNFRSKMIVGLNFTGQIERLHINFLKRHLELASNEALNTNNLYSYSQLNVEYEKSEADEMYRSLDELLLIPCSQMSVSIEIAVKSSSPDGTLLMMGDDLNYRYLVLSVEPRRVQLHYIFVQGVIECFEVIEPHVGLWMHIKIDYGSDRTWGLTVNGGKRRTINKYYHDNTVKCSNFIMIGDVAQAVREKLGSQIIKRLNNESLDGLLGHVEVDGNVLDITSLQGKVEKGEETFSSEAVSSSTVYTEIQIGPDEPLEISCTYKNSSKTTETTGAKPIWLQFDRPLTEDHFGKNGINYAIFDDSAETVLKIYNYSSIEAMEGFFSCWLPNYHDSGILLITYGVTLLDPLTEFSNIYRKLLRHAPILFLILLLLTLLWLLMECLIGLKYEWGFFSRKSIKKRLKKTELYNLAHNQNASSTLGIKSKHTWIQRNKQQN